MYKNKNIGNTAILGWADISKGTSEGGGYNLVAGNHALEIIKQGGSVFYLQSGIHYNLIRKRPQIKQCGRYKEIQCFRLYNSTNRAPALHNLNRQEKHYSSPVQNRAVADWLIENKISQVYIHSLEGQALDLIKEIKKNSEISLYIICHDHFYICPRVNLLYRGADLCLEQSDDSGKCESCIDPDYSKYYEVTQALNQIPLYQYLLRLALRFKRKRENTGDEPDLLINPLPYNSNELFMKSLQRPNRRQRASAESLSYADKVYAPSSFITESLIKIGLPREKTQTFRLSLPHLEKLKSESSKESYKTSDIIRFCYRGSDAQQKGLNVFLESILLLPEKIREQCLFIVRGSQNPLKYKKYTDSIAQLKIYGKYNPDDLLQFTNEYDIGVLPHIWFENSPVTLLEHLASGKKVLSARLGGVTDFIEDGKNGWLFAAGDIDNLAEKIKYITGN